MTCVLKLHYPLPVEVTPDTILVHPSLHHMLTLPNRRPGSIKLPQKAGKTHLTWSKFRNKQALGNTHIKCNVTALKVELSNHSLYKSIWLKHTYAICVHVISMQITERLICVMTSKKSCLLSPGLKMVGCWYCDGKEETATSYSKSELRWCRGSRCKPEQWKGMPQFSQSYCRCLATLWKWCANLKEELLDGKQIGLELKVGYAVVMTTRFEGGPLSSHQMHLPCCLGYCP